MKHASRSALWRSRRQRVLTAGLVTALVFAALAVSQSSRPAAAVLGPNLLSNPSAETPGSTISGPAGWLQGEWGSNTTKFSYPTGGAASGSRYVQVRVTSYKSGDAKWYPNPVSGGPGAYAYSDTYKATVPTRVIVQYTNASGTNTFANLGSPAASSSWVKESFNLNPPTGTKTITTFHLIAGVGTLSLDDISLQASAYTPSLTPTLTSTSPTPTPTPIDTGPSGEMVPNPGAEQGSGTTPTGWSRDDWGSNTRAITWTTDAHTGTHALQVTISNWMDGDAKWTYPAQSVAPGRTYAYSDWYKSTATTQVWVEITRPDGSVYYVEPAAGVDASSTWRQYQGTYVAPTDSAQLRFWHVLSTNGTLTIDDVSMRTVRAPAGLRRGIVSVTFDDGIASTYTDGLPILKKYGISSTQYIISGLLGEPGTVTVAQVQDYVRAGQEIGAHTVDHPDLTALTAAQVQAELANSKSTLEGITGPAGQSEVTTIAEPYGTYNASVLAQIGQSYVTARSTDVGYDTTSVNPLNVVVQDVDVSTSAGQVQSWISYAAAHRYWLVLVYHAVDTTGSQYSTTPADLDVEMAAVRASGLAAEPISAAYAEIKAQA